MREHVSGIFATGSLESIDFMLVFKRDLVGVSAVVLFPSHHMLPDT